MSKFEILCTTMNQKDFSKINEMNISSNVLFANQADRTEYQEYDDGNIRGRMLTTTTRGVGVNRNLLLLYSEADILLFADDDMVYNEDLEYKVLKAFKELPKADVILFGSCASKNGKVYRTTQPKTGKLPIYKSMKFGTYSIAVKKSAILTHNISFTNLFGGGCMYCHGEDSDFIIQCYRKGLKVYSYNYIIGVTSKDSSTWFKGYDEKYFYDTGALAKNTFGIFAKLYMLYMSIRLKNLTEVGFFDRLKLLNAGYKNFKSIKSYKAWSNENKLT